MSDYQSKLGLLISSLTLNDKVSKFQIGTLASFYLRTFGLFPNLPKPTIGFTEDYCSLYIIWAPDNIHFDITIYKDRFEWFYENDITGECLSDNGTYIKDEIIKKLSVFLEYENTVEG